MRSMTPSATSKSSSPWRVVFDGDTALLLLAVATGVPLGTGAPYKTPQPPWTPVLDLGQPSWPQAAVSSCPSLW